MRGVQKAEILPRFIPPIGKDEEWQTLVTDIATRVQADEG